MSFTRAFVAAALLAVVPLCHAQSDQTTEPETSDGEKYASRKQYQVEVITFQYQGPDSAGGERLDRLFVEDYLPSDPFDIDEYNRVREAVSYTEIHSLADAASRLEESPHYQVLTRSAWIQPLLGRDEAVNVPLGEDAPGSGGSLQGDFGSSSPARASGSVRVYGDYLLFVDLNLKVTMPGGATGASRRGDSGSTGGFDDSGDFGGGRRDRGEVFHINERRRIKLDEVHYFDHPYIGAIIRVTRYESNQEASAAAE